MAMRILLINDNSAHPNWGAQASPPSLVAILKNSLPGCTVVSLSHAWLRQSYRRLIPFLGGRCFKSEEWRGLRVILHRLSNPAVFRPAVADDFDYWADEWMEGRGGPQAEEFLAKARAADVILHNGENSIYRNTEEGCRGLFLLWLAKTRLRKVSCIVNHTAHLDDVLPIMPAMANLVYPVLDLVAVREPCSLRNLNALGIQNAELFPDVVFGVDPGGNSRGRLDEWRRERELDGQAYFCLSSSGLPASAPRGCWDGEMTALVRDLKALGLQAVLVAKDPWCQFLEDVARRTGAIFFGPEHEYPELWPLFEGASFLVTGHYHYVIFGAMVGCPFVPLTANNHKMRSVCEHLGWHRQEPFDVTDLRRCRSEIVEEAKRLRLERAGLSAQLRDRAEVLKREARRLGARVAEVAQQARQGSAPVIRGAE